MNEFYFDDQPTPWDLALDTIAPGQTMKATRFLTLMEAMEELSPQEAALELEQRKIALDISDLPVLPGNPETQHRLALEQKIYGTQEWKTTLNRHDPLYQFLDELESCEPCDQIPELAQRSALGDERAMEALTRGLLPQVYETAGAYLGKGVLLADLIQEGSLGLWQGILSDCGDDFSNRSQWWIHQAMARAVTLQALENGVGRHLAQQMDALRRADKELLTRLGRNPTLAELSQELGVTLEQAMALTKLMREIHQLSKLHPQQEQEPQETEEDDQLIEDTSYFQTRQRIDNLMTGLTDQEQELLNLRYGLNGKTPLTAQEVALRFGWTAQEVVEAEAAALTKMRT